MIASVSICSVVQKALRGGGGGCGKGEVRVGGFNKIEESVTIKDIRRFCWV